MKKTSSWCVVRLSKNCTWPTILTISHPLLYIWDHKSKSIIMSQCLKLRKNWKKNNFLPLFFAVSYFFKNSTNWNMGIWLRPDIDKSIRKFQVNRFNRSWEIVGIVLKKTVWKKSMGPSCNDTKTITITLKIFWILKNPLREIFFFILI